MSSIKKDLAKNTIWNSVERFSNMGIQLLCTFILARYLTPSDYGIIAAGNRNKNGYPLVETSEHQWQRTAIRIECSFLRFCPELHHRVIGWRRRQRPASLTGSRKGRLHQLLYRQGTNRTCLCQQLGSYCTGKISSSLSGLWVKFYYDSCIS